MNNRILQIATFLTEIDNKNKKLLKLVCDSFLVIFALFLSFTIRLENLEFLLDLNFYFGACLAIFSALAVFVYRGLYGALTRQVSADVATNIFSEA